MVHHQRTNHATETTNSNSNGHAPASLKRGVQTVFSVRFSHVQAVEVVLQDLRRHGRGHAKLHRRRRVGASGGHRLLSRNQVRASPEPQGETKNHTLAARGRDSTQREKKSAPTYHTGKRRWHVQSAIKVSQADQNGHHEFGCAPCIAAGRPYDIKSHKPRAWGAHSHVGRKQVGKVRVSLTSGCARASWERHFSPTMKS